jgi:hypothetical protein
METRKFPYNNNINVAPKCPHPPSALGLDRITISTPIINSHPYQRKFTIRNSTIRIRHSYSRFHISFNPTTFYNDQQINPLSLAEYREVFLEVQSQLRRFIPNINIFRCHFSYIEIFKSITLNHFFADFAIAVKTASLKFPYKSTLVWQFPDSYTIYINTNHYCLIVYDKHSKAVKLLNRRKNIAKKNVEKILPEKVIRPELRLKNKSTIEKILGFSRVEDLFQLWSTVEKIYSEQFLKLFNKTPMKKQLGDNILSQDWFNKPFKERIKQKKPHSASAATKEILFKLLTQNNLGHLIENLDTGSRKLDHRLKQEFADYSLANEKIKEVNLADLYNELKRKITESTETARGSLKEAL